MTRPSGGQGGSIGANLVFAPRAINEWENESPCRPYRSPRPVRSVFKTPKHGWTVVQPEQSPHAWARWSPVSP